MEEKNELDSDKAFYKQPGKINGDLSWQILKSKEKHNE